MFAAAVSLVTGKILYISNQVASIFHCKRDTFHEAKFVEFLAPHDVSVFHSSTTPYKLPPWSVCRGAGEGPTVVARGEGGASTFPGGPGWAHLASPETSTANPPKGLWPPPLSKAKEKKLFVQVNLEKK